MESVFYSMSSAWKVTDYPYFASRKSEPSPPTSLYRSASTPPGVQGWVLPRNFESHVTPRSTLIGPLAQLQRGHLQNCSRNLGGSTNRSEFCHLGGIDKLIFWSHYVLKQLIGRLLLCGICHIMVNLP